MSIKSLVKALIINVLILSSIIVIAISIIFLNNISGYNIKYDLIRAMIRFAVMAFILVYIGYLTLKIAKLGDITFFTIGLNIVFGIVILLINIFFQITEIVNLILFVIFLFFSYAIRDWYYRVRRPEDLIKEALKKERKKQA
jgi:hypothetical protein